MAHFGCDLIQIKNLSPTWISMWFATQDCIQTAQNVMKRQLLQCYTCLEPAAMALFSSRPVSHLHSSTTITRFSRTSAPQRRGTVTVWAFDGAQREQGARRWKAPVSGLSPSNSPSDGTKRELHWPKHSLLCTVTVSHPSAVTCWEDDSEGQV